MGERNEKENRIRSATRTIQIFAYGDEKRGGTYKELRLMYSHRSTQIQISGRKSGGLGLSINTELENESVTR
jgi:hypothetical protein